LVSNLGGRGSCRAERPGRQLSKSVALPGLMMLHLFEV
jgi:hypothetical protein